MEYPIRSYGREELASLYNPNETPESAWRLLRSWIRANRQLSESLSRLGYDGHHRRFTPLQVSEIFRYLGSPSD